MAKLSTDQLIDGFKDLSLIELSEFVKKFEEVFEVTAAAPVAVAAAGAPAAGGGDADAAEEKTYLMLSSKLLVTRKSRSSRRCARSPTSVWVRRRHSLMALPVLCSRAQTRRPRTRQRQLSKRLAQPSPSSSQLLAHCGALLREGATGLYSSGSGDRWR